MAKPPLTPEEKLLQIIDNPSMAKDAPRGRWGSRLPSSLRLAITRLAAALKGGRSGAQPVLTLRLVNRGLMVLCSVLALCWVVDFFTMRSAFLTRLQTVERTQLTAPAQPKSPSRPTLDFAEVLEGTRRRNVFSLLPPKAEATAPAAPAEDLSLYLDNLKLVGIIWSDTPQAMIEQVKESKTLLVGAGEMVGSLRVKQILREKVILQSEPDGQEWELR